jgi:hypothetical protein
VSDVERDESTQRYVILRRTTAKETPEEKREREKRAALVESMTGQKVTGDGDQVILNG